VLLTSDAHDTGELGLVDFAARHAYKARVPSSRVANTWPGERLRAFVAKR
jgi:histidinol phosphatase-like PHP family hydrolase